MRNGGASAGSGYGFGAEVVGAARAGSMPAGSADVAGRLAFGAGPVLVLRMPKSSPGWLRTLGGRAAAAAASSSDSTSNRFIVRLLMGTVDPDLGRPHTREPPACRERKRRNS